MDFSTPEGWKKAIITIVGMIVPVLAAFGLKEDILNTMTTGIIAAADLIALIGYWIVNQIAAKGKAAQVIKVIEANSALVTAVAKTGADVAPLVQAMANSGTDEKGEVKEPEISLVKDRIAKLREYYAIGKNYREYLIGSLDATIRKWQERMTQVNPNYPTIEAVKQVAAEFFNRNLTEKECGTIQSIMGLPPLLHAMGDVSILNSFFGAFDRMPELAYMETYFREFTIMRVTKDTIEEAASRARKGDVDIKAAKLALREFGYSELEVNKTQWSGNTITAVYETTPGAEGGSYRPFMPYSRAGYPEFELIDNS